LSGKIADMSLPNPKRFSGCNRHRGGHSYRRTQFTDSAGTYHPVFEVSGKALDDCVWQKIVSALSEPEVFIEEYLEHQNLETDQIDQLEVELNRLREAQTFCREVEIPRIKTAYERELYEIDELQTRLTEKNEELNRFREQIKTIEERIEMASQRSKEITALQNTARQIKFKLDDLPHEQKAALCQLFVKRVELTREKRKHQQGWDIQAEIFYRFSPERACTKNLPNRTSSSQKEAKKGVLKSESALSGDHGEATCHLFSFKALYLSNRRVANFKFLNQ
jgi:chromosome segregation ATPase